MKNQKAVFYIKSILATVALSVVLLPALAFGVIALCILSVAIAGAFVASTFVYVKKNGRLPQIHFKRRRRVYNGKATVTNTENHF